MKIRLNYVSNSSSSSFCIFGYKVDKDNLPENVDLNEIDNMEDLQLVEVFNGLQDYQDETFIGAEIYKMKDEETLKEFRYEILNEVHKIGFKDASINDIKLYQDCGWDG